jgi:phosphatidylglycerophosphatase A
MCFVVSRVMDIVKPFPAYRLQKLPSGLGITIDDVVASLYALGANWALYLAIQGI